MIAIICRSISELVVALKWIEETKLTILEKVCVINQPSLKAAETSFGHSCCDVVLASCSKTFSFRLGSEEALQTNHFFAPAKASEVIFISNFIVNIT